jgi:uncharacterized glyoxalase superfamily protein PhnB
MPDLPTVVPMVSYEDCAAAADSLVRAFAFEEEERYDDGGEATHVTLRLGDGVVFLGKPGEAYVDPARHREQCETAARMYEVPWVVDGVYASVPDVDAHAERARAAGARLLSEPHNGPVGRLYRIDDPYGHRWMFAQA